MLDIMADSGADHHCVLDVVAEGGPPLRTLFEAPDALDVCTASAAATLGRIPYAGGFKLAHGQLGSIAVARVGVAVAVAVAAAKGAAVGDEGCCGRPVAIGLGLKRGEVEQDRSVCRIPVCICGEGLGQGIC